MATKKPIIKQKTRKLLSTVKLQVTPQEVTHILTAFGQTAEFQMRYEPINCSAEYNISRKPRVRAKEILTEKIKSVFRSETFDPVKLILRSLTLDIETQKMVCCVRHEYMEGDVLIIKSYTLTLLPVINDRAGLYSQDDRIEEFVCRTSHGVSDIQKTALIEQIKRELL